jgi:hypothetical protein
MESLKETRVYVICFTLVSIVGGSLWGTVYVQSLYTTNSSGRIMQVSACLLVYPSV